MQQQRAYTLLFAPSKELGIKFSRFSGVERERGPSGGLQRRWCPSRQPPEEALEGAAYGTRARRVRGGPN